MGVNVHPCKRGPGYRRFNNYWLTDSDFLDEMETQIELAKDQDMTNPNLKWEWVKHKIREFSIAFTIRRSRAEKAWIEEAERRLSFLVEHHDLTSSPEIVNEVSSLKRELGEIEKHKANRALFKSKANWTQLGERPTAYFLGLEKRQSKDKTITFIKDENERILTNKDEILEYERRYFTNIYNEDPTTLEPLENMNIPEEHIPQVTVTSTDERPALHTT